jgi:signal transduction histidine kinase
MGNIAPGGSLTNEVLAVVSHDLRNPLSTVHAGTLLLADESQTREQRAEVVQIIRRSLERMDRLVRDLVEVSALDGGRGLRVDPRPHDLGPLMEEARRAQSAQAERAGLRLELDVPVHALVLADGDRVVQILGNLLGNAIKFTPRGGRVRLAARASGTGMEVSVDDDGSGLTAEEAEHVFDPFWQAERTARLGTGLGLKIAKALVEAHGGRIRVESRPGAGTTFAFTLQAAEAA